MKKQIMKTPYQDPPSRQKQTKTFAIFASCHSPVIKRRWLSINPQTNSMSECSDTFRNSLTTTQHFERKLTGKYCSF